MVKYMIKKGMHYVYSYAKHDWHCFDNMNKAFEFMKEEIDA